MSELFQIWFGKPEWIWEKLKMGVVGRKTVSKLPEGILGKREEKCRILISG